jgi:hypothetical protein
MGNRVTVTAMAFLREVNEATLRRSDDSEDIYLWIGGAGTDLSIIADSLQQLLVIRDAITEFEFSEKVAAAAKNLITQQESVAAE